MPRNGYLKTARGTTRIERMLVEMERKDRAVADARVLDQFGNFLRLLHVDCFGEGDYAVEVVERALRKLPEYIRTIESL